MIVNADDGDAEVAISKSTKDFSDSPRALPPERSKTSVTAGIPTCAHLQRVGLVFRYRLTRDCEAMK